MHLHSCLSPCGGDDVTPADLAGMCAVAGLQVAALTDHNTCANCPAFCRAAQAHGLVALAGMELCTTEEVHVLCLFPTPERARLFSLQVDARTRWQANHPEIFGRQLVMDEDDHLLEEDPRLLAGATGVGVYEAAQLATAFGGVALPAHIDRDAFSLLSNLGLWDSALNFPLAEVSPRCPPELLKRPDLAGVRTITGSDSHYLHQIPDASHWLEVPQATPQAVLDWLKN